MASNRDELIQKVKDYVDRDFGGDYKSAFLAYDEDHDGRASLHEIYLFLKAAGVGNFLTRGLWAQGVMNELDKNRDGFVDKSEFMAVFNKEEG